MMNTQLLEQFSSALAERAAAVKGSVAAIRINGWRNLSATLWRPDVAVASEQSLPDRDEFELVIAGGETVKAKVIGRDPGTNVAALKLERAIEFSEAEDSEPQVGAIALAFGADGAGGVRSRLGTVNMAGPEWTSRAGGRIDRHVVLDITLGRAEEGGPVLDASGKRLGISTFGPRGRVLVIPSATVERAVTALLKDGRVARGWLGVALQPVAVPEALREQGHEEAGAMVMSIVPDGPAAKAGLVAGDIVLTVNGTPARRVRRLAASLGEIGRTAELRVARGGAVISVQATIEARPAQ
jgi:S1-C subfamily serine protease